MSKKKFSGLWTLLRYTGRLILGVIIFVLTYLVLAVILGVMPVNRNYAFVERGIPIYVLSNGVHTDFVVPTVTKQKDWREVFRPELFAAPVTEAKYVGIGWGDKGFYLETPTWAELKPSVAFRAAFLPSATAMHVTYHPSAPIPGPRCRRIYISEAQYETLIQYVLRQFERNDDQQFIFIPESGYSDYDNFYEALESYTLIHTCNTWVNRGLKRLGVRTAIWSPFDKGILYHLQL